MTNFIEIYVFDKKMFPGGCLPLPLDYIYILPEPLGTKLVDADN